ncbi:MAG: 3-hydroxyacyl-ACP dehydratase FabZ [Chloroflexota bacterium]|nr:3-hydroxyacyl-ACP dehydratase FabZ [Chloroflexota bacterium]
MSAVLDRKGIEALIPHRDPFLLIDRIIELDPLVRAVGEHDFTGEDYYFRGHFPGNPIVPGVILAESMAQVATVCAMAHPDYREGLGLFAGIEEMRFKRIVRPGETGRFTATFEKMRRGFGRARVTTHVGDELAAEGVILAIFQPVAKVTP